MAEIHKYSDIRLRQVLDYDAERRLRFVNLQPLDLAHIADLKDDVIKHLDEHVAAFFAYLDELPEGSGLFPNREMRDEAVRMKREHLIAMVGGEYGKEYVEQRIAFGVAYSRAGLDARMFLGGFHALLRSLGARIMQKAKAPMPAFDRFSSLKKVAFFDLGIIIDVLIADRESTIAMQQEAIRELSTPTLQVRDRLLILPIIGVLDTHRARQLTENLLRSIRDNRAKVVVMDVTGVATVDTKVANHLLQTIAASRLMGAEVIITGLSAEVAQSLVTLGVDLAKLNAVGDLQGGLELAERLLGYELVRIVHPGGGRASA
ncbi:protoglobin domain-containing protein [Phenylobacterium sp.]|uniref:protoglobin domain-containing protein n=1 Tax=Phenylobacterium sp. TaxID=1871053 RepID=UPI00273357D5|nr:protoglobin domain-containing protein [Phenylobacterium sp.]MDP3854075.1 protoglobin domain-containing protein [Phenylobacterium sp.]